jgi:DNA-binding MarR family transcriptional regulator
MPEEPRLLGALFRIPFQVLNIRIEQGLIAHGYEEIRPAYFEVFRHIDPDGSRVTELAERAQMTKQSMGYLVDHLEKMGYVERIPDPQDGRAKRIILTESGRHVEQTARRIIHEVEAEWRDMLGEEQMSQLRDTLEHLIRQLENTAAQ